ncbi:uncharacterized protein DS421_18g620380 [Arachis hypogaea]|nr:uncharacterized protein DS421_18g620380 [Arachis hypogaea]
MTEKRDWSCYRNGALFWLLFPATIRSSVEAGAAMGRLKLLLILNLLFGAAKANVVAVPVVVA